MTASDSAVAQAAAWLARVEQLNARYRAGEVHVHVPSALLDNERPLEELVARHLPASQAALDAAAQGLFFSLPVALDPADSVGPYLAVIDRDAADEPYRFLDMGALIATQALGETLIEDRFLETGPPWIRGATVLKRLDNYLRSGIAFVYLQTAIQPGP